MADYGSIPLGAKTRFDFYIFERKVELGGGRFNLQNSLSDGRFVIGAISTNRWQDKFQRFLRHRPSIEVEIKEPFRLRRPADEATKGQIVEELLTRRCGDCNEPTRYELSFVTFRGPFGGGAGYIILACLAHLNEAIKREGRDWTVFEGENTLQFGGYTRVLGRARYNAATEQFEQVLVGPPVEQPVLEEMSFSVSDEPVYRFSRETGVLEIGDHDLFQRLKEQLGEIPEKGIPLVFHLPFAAEPVTLSGVKSIEYAQGKG